MGLSHGDELDGQELLRKYSRLPVDQIEFVAEPTLETIADIKRGLLFLVALWSDPAMRAFATLTEELADLDFHKYRFVAGDVDGGRGASPTSGSRGLFNDRRWQDPLDSRGYRTMHSDAHRWAMGPLGA